MEATAYGAIVLAGGGARRMGGARKPEVRVGGVPMIERVLAAVTPAGAPLVVGPSDLVLPAGVAVIQEAPPGGGPAAAVAAAFAASPGPLAPTVPAPIVPAPTVPAPIVPAPIVLAPIVAVVAGDLPLLTAGAVRALLDAARTDGVDGAVYVDMDGRPQWLCGAWRTAALAARVASLANDRDRPGRAGDRDRDRLGLGGGDRDRPGLAGDRDRAGLAGVALRHLFGALTFARLPARAAMNAEMASARADDLPPWFDCDTEDDIRRAEEWLSR